MYCCFQWCTNVILAIRHYPNLCRDTCFVTGVDKKHRETPLAPTYNALGAMKAASLRLVSIHFMGRYHWTICWQGKVDFFESVGRTWLRQWQSTGTFKAWCGRTTIWSNHSDHWNICLSAVFASHRIDECTKKKQAQSSPPSFTSSSYNASPVYQAMTWYNDGLPNPGLPQPVDYG